MSSEQISEQDTTGTRAAPRRWFEFADVDFEMLHFEREPELMSIEKDSKPRREWIWCLQKAV